MHPLSGQPADTPSTNCWSTGKRPVPTSTITILALLEMLPKTTLRKLIKASGGPRN